MKNIIFLGVSRAGKRTFAKTISKGYSSYNLIQEDTISSVYSTLQEIESEKQKRFPQSIYKNGYEYSL